MKTKKVANLTLTDQLQNFQKIMRNILQQGVKSLIQWITEASLRIIVILFIFIFLRNTILYGQHEQNLTEEIRGFIFMSIEVDGPYKYNITKWDDLLPVLKNHHDNLQVEVSDVYSFVLPNSRDTIRDGYTLQLFKIACDNSRNQSRYLLRYEGFEGVLWLRVAGYVENDVKVFFDYLRRKGVKKKDFAKIVGVWEDSDVLFREIDFRCILKGYIKGETSSGCFVAASYVEILDSSIGFEPISEKEIYGVFSRVPLKGSVVLATKW